MATLNWQRIRDVSSSISDAKSSFSSWDSCMSKTYCKWPVIVAIIIVSLIVLSVVFCVVRCCCCGLECCCGCFKCFNACCPSPRRRKGHKNLDNNPPSSYQNQNYPQYGGAGAAPYRSPAPLRYDNTPQFATFDASKGNKVNDDALPAMPSWDNAATHKVEVEETADHPGEHEKDGMEMQQLYENPPSPPQTGQLSPGGQSTGVIGGRPPPGGRSPTGNSYGPVSSSGLSGNESYVGSDVSGRTDYYNQSQNAPYGAAAGGYRRQSPGPNQGFQPSRTQQNFQSPGALQPAYQQPAYQQPQYQAYNGSQPNLGGGQTSLQQQQYSPRYQQQNSARPQPAATHMEEPAAYVGSRKPVDGSWRDI